VEAGMATVVHEVTGMIAVVVTVAAVAGVVE
jgi:hypothetical protein